MRMEEVKGKSATPVPREYSVIKVEGRNIQVDEGGYLVNPADWSSAVAVYMAEVDELELGEDHWLLINFLNRFYSEYEVAPSLGILSRNLCKDQKNCRWSRKYIKVLFPEGARMACRYAGLPMPVIGSCV